MKITHWTASRVLSGNGETLIHVGDSDKTACGKRWWAKDWPGKDVVCIRDTPIPEKLPKGIGWCAKCRRAWRKADD